MYYHTRRLLVKMGLSKTLGLIVCFYTLVSGEIRLMVNDSDISQLQAEEHVTVVEGDYLVFRCESDLTGARHVWIIGDNGPVVVGSTLEIKAVGLKDEGIYYCRATQNGTTSNTGVVELKSVFIEVLIPPSVPVITQPLTCIVGEQIELTCSSTGIPAPDFQWRDNTIDGIILSRNRTYRTVILNNFYITCIAQARLFTTLGEPRYEMKSRKISQTVQIMADVYIDKGNVKTFSRGENVSILCNYRGYPIPKLWWTKVDDENFNFPGKSLEIYNIRPSDCGIYVCHGENIIVPQNGSRIDTYDSDRVQIFVLENGTDGECRSSSSFKESASEAVSYAAITLAVLSLVLGLISIGHIFLSRRIRICLNRKKKDSVPDNKDEINSPYLTPSKENFGNDGNYMEFEER